MSDRFVAYEAAQERRAREAMLVNPARLVRYADAEALRQDIDRRISDLRALIAGIEAPTGWAVTHRELAARGCDRLREMVDEAFGGTNAL